LMSLSRAVMALSRADTSVGRLEALWIRCARIMIVTLFGSMIYGVSLIILALRDEYVDEARLALRHGPSLAHLEKKTEALSL
jgi:hypothetical protein